MSEDIMRRLFERLDEEQALVAEFRLANYRIPEIVAKTGLSRRTIARRLKEIRRIWDRSGLLDRNGPADRSRFFWQCLPRSSPFFL
jgi:ECF sigma factor